MGMLGDVGTNVWGLGRATECEVRQMAPLALAYLGDAVFELFVRDRLLREAQRPQRELHRQAVRRVRASAQAKAIRSVLTELTEEEADIVRRGRNARVQVPKGADPADQHFSTAFEALVGYLYLLGRVDRVNQLMQRAFDGVNP